MNLIRISFPDFKSVERTQFYKGKQTGWYGSPDKNRCDKNQRHPEYRSKIQKMHRTGSRRR